jgi:hypothetical protein
MGPTRRWTVGTRLIVPLEYATNPTVGSSTPWQETEFQETDEFTSAQYTWKQIDGSIALSKMDIAQNSGEAQIVNLMKAKLSNLERSIKQNFNQQMYQGNGTVCHEHQRDHVDLVSSSGTIGGIASTSANYVVEVFGPFLGRGAGRGDDGDAV